MLIRLLLAFALFLGAPAALAAQQRDARPGLWTRDQDRITFTTARISFPLRAGAIGFSRSAELSHHGEGIDNALQYVARDEQVFATVYIYLPGLAHAGFTAFMTDHVIGVQSGNDLSRSGSRIVAAGGREGVAIRSDYAGFRSERLASSAAFIKAGRWILKVRVSGPQSRRAEVEAVMSALLDGVRFEGDLQPRAAAQLQIDDCQSAPSAARALPDNATNLIEFALVAAFDGAGEEARHQNGTRVEALPGRVGARWCRSARARLGNASYSILRAAPGESGDGLGGRSVLIVPVNDAGTSFELVELTKTGQPSRFVGFYHEIGRTSVLGAYDGPLSDEQVAAILTGSDREGGQIRTSVRLLPSGNTEINVPMPEDPPAPTT